MGVYLIRLNILHFTECNLFKQALHVQSDSAVFNIMNFFHPYFCILIKKCAIAVNRLLKYKYSRKTLIRGTAWQCNDVMGKHRY